MTDETVAVAPAAEGVPIETGKDTPNPVEKTLPGGDKPEAKRSLDDIIADAETKVMKADADKDKSAKPKDDDTKEKVEPDAKKDAKPEPKADAKAKEEPKAEPKPEPKADGPARDDNGKFASQQPKAETKPAPHHEPPSRFDDAAKAEWATAPESVKGATHRVLREMEGGIQKYKGDADSYAELKEFADLAKQHGTTMKQAMTQFTNLDRALISQDINKKLGAIEHVFKHAGINPREYAARIMGQTPDQVGAEQHKQITTLHGQNTALARENATLKAQLQEKQANEINQIGADHPRFDELRAKMGRLVNAGLVDGDDEKTIVANAYALADRLYPAASEPLTPASIEPAHTRIAPANEAGSKSITGAPASGSDPAVPSKRKGKSSSIDDALERAFARLAS